MKISPEDKFHQKFKGLHREEILYYEIFKNSLVTSLVPLPSLHNEIESSSSSVRRVTDQEHVSRSYFPELDAIISSLVSTTGGFVKGFKYLTNNRILYGIARSKYCRNVGRSHTRNHIYFIANLYQSHVKQYCHSKSCRGYASEPIYFQLLSEELCNELFKPWQ